MTPNKGDGKRGPSRFAAQNVVATQNMAGSKGKQRPAPVQKLIEQAMELERQTMELYCLFETQFSQPEELRNFWFEMAQHESRHFGALALVAGLMRGESARPLAAGSRFRPEHVAELRRLLRRYLREAGKGVSLERAFEMALTIESSEIEDVVLDLTEELRGEAEREKAARLLIHDLGDLTYMIEKYTQNADLLARADALLESQVRRLQPATTAARARSARPQPVRRVVLRSARP